MRVEMRNRYCWVMGEEVSGEGRGGSGSLEEVMW